MLPRTPPHAYQGLSVSQISSVYLQPRPQTSTPIAPCGHRPSSLPPCQTFITPQSSYNLPWQLCKGCDHGQTKPDAPSRSNHGTKTAPCWWTAETTTNSASCRPWTKTPESSEAPSQVAAYQCHQCSTDNSKYTHWFWVIFFVLDWIIRGMLIHSLHSYSGERLTPLLVAFKHWKCKMSYWMIILWLQGLLVRKIESGHCFSQTTSFGSASDKTPIWQPSGSSAELIASTIPEALF